MMKRMGSVETVFSKPVWEDGRWLLVFWLFILPLFVVYSLTASSCVFRDFGVSEAEVNLLFRDVL